jgi:hypothetical protein
LAHRCTCGPLGRRHRLQVLERTITVIVPRELEPIPRNALWALFSFEAKKVVQGAKDYRWRQGDHASVLHEIYHRYRGLGVTMSQTFEDFRHDLARELLQELPPEDRLRGLPEDHLKGLSNEESARLKAPLQRREPTKKA